jgi:hypothetical protein
MHGRIDRNSVRFAVLRSGHKIAANAGRSGLQIDDVSFYVRPIVNLATAVEPEIEQAMRFLNS